VYVCACVFVCFVFEYNLHVARKLGYTLLVVKPCLRLIGLAVCALPKQRRIACDSKQSQRLVDEFPSSTPSLVQPGLARWEALRACAARRCCCAARRAPMPTTCPALTRKSSTWASTCKVRTRRALPHAAPRPGRELARRLLARWLHTVLRSCKSSAPSAVFEAQ